MRIDKLNMEGDVPPPVTYDPFSSSSSNSGGLLAEAAVVAKEATDGDIATDIAADSSGEGVGNSAGATTENNVGSISEAPSGVSGKTKPISLLICGKENQISPEDVIVEVTVGGEKKQVSLHDLRNNYSGEAGFQKKFTELDRQHKEAIKRLAEREQQIMERETSAYENSKSFVSNVLSGKAKEAIDKQLEELRCDREVFWIHLMEQILPDATEYAKLTPDQRKTVATFVQNKYLSKENESLKGDTDKTRKTQESLNQIRQMIQQSGVSVEEIQTEWKNMEQLAGLTKANQPNGLPAQDIEYLQRSDDRAKYQYVINRVLANRQLDRVEGILSQVSDTLAKDTKAIKRLFLSANLGSTDEDLLAEAKIMAGLNGNGTPKTDVSTGKGGSPRTSQQTVSKKEEDDDTFVYDKDKYKTALFDDL